MRRNQPTGQPADRQGFVQIPNSLCRLGTPLQIAIYARWALRKASKSVGASWGRSMSRRPRSDLTASTGAAATDKEIRGALAALIESGFLTCLDKGGGRRARSTVSRAKGPETEGT